MAKAEWGTKRVCLNCGKPFYDLNKDPIKCPICGETLSVEEFLRQQASGAGKVKRGSRKLHDEVDVAEDEAEFVNAPETDLILEDASDLGDDNHDMAEVMDNVEKGEE